MPSLRIKAPQGTSVYHLHKKVTSVGSAPDCDLVLPDPLLAESFAHILFDGQVYAISTTSRKNELLVNGKKRKKHTLRDDDLLVVGSLELRFSMMDGAADLRRGEAASPLANTDAYALLYEFSARLMEKHELSELLEELMDAVIELTRADKGFLILTEGDVFDVKVARNLQRENIADAIHQLSDSIVAKVVESQRPVIVSDAMNDDEFSSSKSVMKLQLTSVICVPLLEKGTLLGILYVGNDSVRELFAEETLRVLTIFAAQASLIVANALHLRHLQVDNRALSERLEGIRFGQIIGTSPAMQEIYRSVEKVAATDISVLITGETGTGKELIAREIHVRSPRADAPFITINCGAIPENLLESELFGHVKGAFTGAVTTKLGRFQSASRGTLFLDEIGEMPMSLQVKILRALQERTVIKVGATHPEEIDIRILAATHRDLPAEIGAGRFREDLFYRLNVINLHLPPLRERGEDVLVVARYLLSRYIEEYSTEVRGFSPKASIAIRSYHWPGNIREMENRLKKAIILAESSYLGPGDLGLTSEALPAIVPLAEAKEKFQREYINEVLARNNGNRTQTARDLGVDPRTVFRHLEKEESDSP